MVARPQRAAGWIGWREAEVAGLCGGCVSGRFWGWRGGEGVERGVLGAGLSEPTGAARGLPPSRERSDFKVRACSTERLGRCGRRGEPRRRDLSLPVLASMVLAVLLVLRWLGLLVEHERRTSLLPLCCMQAGSGGAGCCIWVARRTEKGMIVRVLLKIISTI